MRALFLLYGAPGTGKSSLIEHLGVENLTLGYDRMRALFGTQIPCAELDGTVGVSPRLGSHVQAAVVSATHEALKARMDAGATIFFDSTMARTRDQTTLAKLARSYGYDTYLIDVQGETSLEELLERNRHRGADRVVDEVLASMHEDCARKDFSEALTGVLTLTPERRGHEDAFAAGLERRLDYYDATEAIKDQIKEITALPAVVSERTVVVGDVHSCAEALQEAVDALDAEGTQWVFAGDLFDRGPDPVGVWKIVHELLGQGRAHVVTGNHEKNLRALNTHTNAAPFNDTRATRDALLAAGVMAAEQTRFVDSTVPALRIQKQAAGASWIVTHGGVGWSTRMKMNRDGLLHVSDAECIYGISSREKTYLGRGSYDVAAMPVAGNQIHGHRNGERGQEPVPTLRPGAGRGEVICLETGVASGGKLSAVVLDEHGATVHSFDDHVDASTAQANQQLPWERKRPQASDDAAELLARMRASEHVRVKPVAGVDGVVACNFTRRAFIEGAWDELTMHARGLFVDEATGKIVARGYEKFFHIGEQPGRDLDAWMDPAVTAYPVVLRKKFNGFLTLVSSINGRLEVFSKSGITDYSRFARGLLVDAIGEDGLGQLADMLGRTKTTAAFEVIAAADTHPIAETGPDRLVLLDCIRNQAGFATNDKLVAGIAARFGFDVAETVATAQNPGELMIALAEARRRIDEGVVLMDGRGYRSKLKAELYAQRKGARTALERVWRGKATGLGPHLAELEARMQAAGVLARLGDFEVVGVDGRTRLDIAAAFEAADAAR